MAFQFDISDRVDRRLTVISRSFILIKPVDENMTTRNESIYFPLSHYAIVLFITERKCRRYRVIHATFKV